MTLVDTSTRATPRATLADVAHKRWAVSALLGLLATAVAAWGSWIPSLWGDEVTSLMSAQRSLPSLFKMLGHVDAVHGTYYLGLHGWIKIFGTSPFSIRFPSAIIVGFAVAATVALAWRLADRRIAVIAGLVCVLLPRVTYMGEEARSYAFSAAIAAWLTLVLVEILARRKPRKLWWVAYGTLLALGTYFFLYVVLFVIVHFVLLYVTRSGRTVLAPWAITVAGAAVACSPLVLFAFLERSQISYLAATEQVTFNSVFSSLWFSTWTVAVLAWALIAYAVGSHWRDRILASRAGTDVGAEPATGTGPLPSLVATGLAWLLIPSAILIAVNTFTPGFTARYVSFCAPAAALLIAVGIGRLSRIRRWVPLVAGLALFALILPVYFDQRTPYAKNGSDWAVVSSTMAAHAQTGDGVVFDETVRPSRRPRLAMHAYPAGFKGVIDVGLKVPFTKNRTWYDSALTVPQAAKAGRFDGIRRVWLLEDTRNGGRADSYGRADLVRLGFQPVGSPIRTHTTQITEFER
ncbi:MAG: glycosyltransferase family 39 protein [Actinomycetales bacterium]|jgi:mannosyltransferase|nr:glycosyltransferase family 39 protein [Leifsonia sp.]